MASLPYSWKGSYLYSGSKCPSLRQLRPPPRPRPWDPATATGPVLPRPAWPAAASAWRPSRPSFVPSGCQHPYSSTGPARWHRPTEKVLKEAAGDGRSAGEPCDVEARVRHCSQADRTEAYDMRPSKPRHGPETVTIVCSCLATGLGNPVYMLAVVTVLRVLTDPGEIIRGPAKAGLVAQLVISIAISRLFLHQAGAGIGSADNDTGTRRFSSGIRHSREFGAIQRVSRGHERQTPQHPGVLSVHRELSPQVATRTFGCHNGPSREGANQAESSVGARTWKHGHSTATRRHRVPPVPDGFRALAACIAQVRAWGVGFMPVTAGTDGIRMSVRLCSLVRLLAANSLGCPGSRPSSDHHPSSRGRVSGKRPTSQPIGTARFQRAPSRVQRCLHPPVDCRQGVRLPGSVLGKQGRQPCLSGDEDCCEFTGLKP